VSATSFADLDKGIDASWLSSAWGPSYFAPDAKSSLGDWRAAALPQWTAGANVAANWGGSTYPVFTQSKHPKEAAEFAEWLNATDASWNITKTAPSSLFSTYLPLLNDPSYKSITVQLSGSSTPGTQFHYSGVGFAIAGRLVERRPFPAERAGSLLAYHGAHGHRPAQRHHRAEPHGAARTTAMPHRRGPDHGNVTSRWFGGRGCGCCCDRGARWGCRGGRGFAGSGRRG